MKKLFFGAFFGTLILQSCKRAFDANETPEESQRITQTIPEYGVTITLDHTGNPPDSSKIFVSDNFTIQYYDFHYLPEYKIGDYTLRFRNKDTQDKNTYYVFGRVDFANSHSTKNTINYFKKIVDGGDFYF